MKRILLILIAVMISMAACAPKPQYKTRQGKKKLKEYNMHQFDNYKVKKHELKKMKH